MRNHISKSIITVLFMVPVVFFSSCAYEIPENSTGTSATEVETTHDIHGTWRLNAYSVEPALGMGDKMVHDLFSENEECLKDDRYIFQAGNQFTLQRGTQLCEGTDEEIRSGWSTDDAQNYLIFNGVKYRFQELSSNRMVLSHEENRAGIVYDFLTILVRE